MTTTITTTITTSTTVLIHRYVCRREGRERCRAEGVCVHSTSVFDETTEEIRAESRLVCVEWVGEIELRGGTLCVEEAELVKCKCV